MFTTSVISGAILFALLLSAALWALFLRLGLYWAKAENVSTQRVIAAAFCCQFVLPMVTLPLSFFVIYTVEGSIGWSIIELGVAIVLPCLLIGYLFGLSLARSFQAWLPTLLTIVVVVPLALFVYRPYVAQAFVTQGNSMAPTIIGQHWKGTCSQCSGPTYCSPIDSRAHGYPPEGISTICSEYFHITNRQAKGESVGIGDRFLVSKFLKPLRWDIVMFQFPENPAANYVLRLVGLPGETIYIDDGKVWANGTPLELPEQLTGLQYESEIPRIRGGLSGTLDKPAQLSDDEYFVLGDFSERATDSRTWQQGAENHPPYAVPKSHLRGVVTHIYWPFSRWRILR